MIDDETTAHTQLDVVVVCSFACACTSLPLCAGEPHPIQPNLLSIAATMTLVGSVLVGVGLLLLAHASLSVSLRTHLRASQPRQSLTRLPAVCVDRQQAIATEEVYELSPLVMYECIAALLVCLVGISSNASFVVVEKSNVTHAEQYVVGDARARLDLSIDLSMDW